MSVNIMKNIGITLKSLREEKGYSLRKLAEIAEVPYSYLSNIECLKRTPGLDVVSRICFALDVPLTHVIIKADIEQNLSEEKRKLHRDLVPYFEKLDLLAQRLYRDSGDANDSDFGDSAEVVTPIIQGGGANVLKKEDK